MDDHGFMVPSLHISITIMMYREVEFEIGLNFSNGHYWDEDRKLFLKPNKEDKIVECFSCFV